MKFGFSADTGPIWYDTDMNLTPHLPPETAAKLQEQATAIGKAPEESALRALEEQLAIEPQSPSAMSAEELIAEMRAWAESHRRLPIEADDSRESIYAGRG